MAPLADEVPRATGRCCRRRRKTADTRARFTFTAAPGLEALEFTAFGRKPEVRADGRKCRSPRSHAAATGAVTYRAVLPRRAELPAEVSLTLTEERGYAGGAAIDGPVKLVCGVGRYTVGDWCRNDALRTYSGAAWYGRDFTLTKKPAGRVTLDLGESSRRHGCWSTGERPVCG